MSNDEGRMRGAVVSGEWLVAKCQWLVASSAFRVRRSADVDRPHSVPTSCPAPKDVVYCIQLSKIIFACARRQTRPGNPGPAERSGSTGAAKTAVYWASAQPSRHLHDLGTNLASY